MSKSIFSPILKKVVRRILPRRTNRYTFEPSYGIEVIKDDVPPELLQGWREPVVAKRQHAAFAPLLKKMYEGKPREDFAALASAVVTTGLKDPLIIEVGCGSGWNSRVLNHLLKRPVRYIGLDYSMPMTILGKRYCPDRQFVVGDAVRLPFRGGACDILISGTVLMHLLGYRDAILESRRVAREWCIFHTVPTVRNRPTTLLRKFAYGSPVIEVVFNIEEFLKLIENSGLVLRQILDNIPHDYLIDVLGEPVSSQTFLCHIT